MEIILKNKVPLAVILIGLVFIIGGLDLGFPAGRFPVMLGGVTIVLAIFEIVGNSFFRTVHRKGDKGPILESVEVVGIAWIFVTIFMIFFFGILPGALISGLIFTRFVEKRTIIKSILISSGIVFIIWFAFAYLAKFDMYSGVFM